MKIRKFFFYLTYNLRVLIKTLSWGILSFSLYYFLLVIFEPQVFILQNLHLLLLLSLTTFFIIFLLIPSRKKAFNLDQELNTGEFFLTKNMVSANSPYHNKILKKEEEIIKYPLAKLFFRGFPYKIIAISLIFFLMANFTQLIFSPGLDYSKSELTVGKIPNLSGEELSILDLEEWWAGDDKFNFSEELQELFEAQEDSKLLTSSQNTEENNQAQEDKNSNYEEDFSDTLKELVKDLNKAFKEPSKEVKENLEKLGIAIEKKDYTSALAALNPLLKELENLVNKNLSPVISDKDGEGSKQEGSGVFGAGSGPATEAPASKTSNAPNPTNYDPARTETSSSLLKKDVSTKTINPITTKEELQLFKDIVTLKLRPVAGSKEELKSELIKVELSKAQALLYLQRFVLPPSVKSVVYKYFENITP